MAATVLCARDVTKRYLMGEVEVTALQGIELERGELVELLGASGSGKVVLAAIGQANRELGTTTVIITHNAAISAMANRVVQLADGRVANERRNSSRAEPAQIQW